MGCLLALRLCCGSVRTAAAQGSALPQPMPAVLHRLPCGPPACVCRGKALRTRLKSKQNELDRLRKQVRCAVGHAVVLGTLHCALDSKLCVCTPAAPTARLVCSGSPIYLLECAHPLTFMQPDPRKREPKLRREMAAAQERAFTLVGAHAGRRAVRELLLHAGIARAPRLADAAGSLLGRSCGLRAELLCWHGGPCRERRNTFPSPASPARR